MGLGFSRTERFDFTGNNYLKTATLTIPLLDDLANNYEHDAVGQIFNEDGDFGLREYCWGSDTDLVEITEDGVTTRFYNMPLSTDDLPCKIHGLPDSLNLNRRVTGFERPIFPFSFPNDLDPICTCTPGRVYAQDTLPEPSFSQNYGLREPLEGLDGLFPPR